MAPVLELIPLADLHFDPENPRLPEKLQRQDESQVFEYFLLECNLLELMLSIGQKGYFAGEPLMVVPRPEGGYIVAEGNRRLAALKLLQPSVTPPLMATAINEVRQTTKEKPTEVPALKFSARDDILDYLGYRHITGIKEWGPLAKARYLKQLRAHYGDDNNEAHKALARAIGSKAGHVAKILTGYNLLERAKDLGILKRLKLDADDIPFSLLTTGIGWEGISKFIGLKSAGDVEAKDLKEKEFEEFFGWVFDKSKNVLKDSRNFEKLARVVDNDIALAELRRGESLENADLLTSGPLEAVRQYMFNAENAIKNAQEMLNLADGLSDTDISHAERIRKAAVSLHSSVKAIIEAAGSEDAES